MKTMKHFYPYICTLIIILLNGSCQLGRHYTRPQLHLPAQLDSLNIDTTSIGDYKWEEIYTDTTLQNIIRKTLEYNKDLLIAGARIKELAAMKRIDYANMFPSVGLRIYGEKEQDNYGGNASSSDNQFDLKGTTSWELDLWGNLRWRKDKSMAEFLSSIENQRALQMSLIAQVAQSYYELAALDNELILVKQTVEARGASLNLARIRYEGGVTSEITFRQAQVELAKTLTLIPDLERRIAQKENDIAFLTGEYPHTIRRAALSEDELLISELPVGLPSNLLERRPDIRQAEQDLIAANAEVGIAYTNLFPKLTLTAQLGAESEELNELLKSPYHLLSGTLLQPIFAMGKNRALLKAKKAAYEQAVYAYEKNVLNAFKETRNAIVEFNKAKEIYETNLRLEQASKSALELAEFQYINKAISHMELLDAQRSYLDAQISLNNAIRDRQLSLVNLYKALGGGWQK